MNKTNQRPFRAILFGLFLFLGTGPLLFAQLNLQEDAKSVKSPSLSEDYQYYDLACDIGEWGGYFAPSRWVRTSESGELGPLAESNIEAGENPSIVFDWERTGVETWSIEIPAAGYLSFRLLPIVAREAVRISVNGRNTFYQIRSDGLYYSPYLQAGDKFSLHIPASGSTYRWSHLLFHTNSNAVIVRPEETDPDKRYQPIESGRIQRVFFPDELPGTWPVFDQDGDILTSYDQVELRSSNELFEVDYLDKVVEVGNFHVLQRTFTIRERCSRGNWLRRSREWFRLPIIPE